MRRESRFDPEGLRRRQGAPGAMGSGSFSELGQGMSMHSRPIGVQLYDNPMPSDAMDKISIHSGVTGRSGLTSPISAFAQGEAEMARDRSSSIKFAQVDDVHRCELSYINRVDPRLINELLDRRA